MILNKLDLILNNKTTREGKGGDSPSPIRRSKQDTGQSIALI